MRILVVSGDEIFGRATAIELCEHGYDARFSHKIDGGYSIYVIDEDSVDSSKLTRAKVTFSTVEGYDLVRPFLISDLLNAVKKAEGDGGADITRFEHIDFTEKERMLLDLLLDNRGKTVSVEEISSRVWGREEASSNIVNVYIRYLREKIEGDGNKRIILTVRGKGYKIE